MSARVGITWCGPAPQRRRRLPLLLKHAAFMTGPNRARFPMDRAAAAAPAEATEAKKAGLADRRMALHKGAVFPQLRPLTRK